MFWSRFVAPRALRHSFAAVSLLGLMISPARVLGQVNVEVLRKALTKSGVHGTLNGSITTYQGNTMGTELGGGALLGYRSGRDLIYLTTNASYANLGGNVQVANAFAHLRYNHKLDEWVAWEVFTQGESDRFRRLRLRTLMGTGPRFTILDGDVASLFYGVSYMYEHTALADSVETRVRPDDVSRLNNYAALLIVLEPQRATLSNTMYYQPRFDDFRDVRLLEILSLDVSVTGRISASLQATLRYEAPVPEPLKRADLMVKNMLGVTF